MPPAQRTRIAIHMTAGLCLAFVTVQYALYGPWPLALLFGIVSVAPLDAAIYLAVHATPTTEARRAAPLTPEHSAALVRAALNQACCERWWTALGTDHDPTCHNRQRRKAA
ncbi:hypothetical protein [Streptomyces apocyni]|uniref:hypothetical protein n=1 Tax=Streptomyces apocyni TaxID=2654677 RepID=UPI0012EAF294|nr:hypothetical protein [Streptomyces apocyni]